MRNTATAFAAMFVWITLSGCSGGTSEADSGVDAAAGHQGSGGAAVASGTGGTAGAPGSGGKPGSGGAAGAPGSGGAGGAPGSGGKAGASGSGGVAGAPGSGGKIGSGGAAGATTCPAPPAGSTADEAAAYTLENDTRAKMGIPCASMVAALNTASRLHCEYYVQNKAAGNTSCIADAHSEVSSCAGFVAASFSARDVAAGYSGAVFEVMAFSSNGTQSVQMWIDSVWHRTPVLSPWVRDFGYGNATQGTARCDTIDFGRGTTTPATAVATYPYAGQTGVPTSFNGASEGPTPPKPATGWPSGYPIHIYAQKATVTLHELRQGSCTGTPVDHIWIAPGGANDPSRLLSNEHVMYAERPLAAATTYCAIVQGTQATSPSQPLDLSWTFTTR